MIFLNSLSDKDVIRYRLFLIPRPDLVGGFTKYGERPLLKMTLSSGREIFRTISRTSDGVSDWNWQRNNFKYSIHSSISFNARTAESFWVNWVSTYWGVFHLLYLNVHKICLKPIISNRAVALIFLGKKSLVLSLVYENLLPTQAPESTQYLFWGRRGGNCGIYSTKYAIYRCTCAAAEPRSSGLRNSPIWPK